MKQWKHLIEIKSHFVVFPHIVYKYILISNIQIFYCCLDVSNLRIMLTLWILCEAEETLPVILDWWWM
jgi:hypothetical protein